MSASRVAEGNLAQGHLGEVREDVVADDPTDPRLLRGGADREAPAQRVAGQRDVTQVVVVDDRRDDTAPVGRQRQVVLLEDCALAGALEDNDVVAPPHEVVLRGEELLHVAVEATEQHHGAQRVWRGAPVGVEAAARIGNGLPGRVFEPEHQAHRRRDPPPGRDFPGVVGQHGELRGP